MELNGFVVAFSFSLLFLAYTVEFVPSMGSETSDKLGELTNYGIKGKTLVRLCECT